MTKDSWQARLTKTVAGEIRRYRTLRKMSGQALVDRCAQLGLAMPAAVLSNLELGRRESISVAELVVLAQALEVSPTLLVAPVTTAGKMEILPGREASTVDVLQWFAGQAEFTLTRTGLSKKDVLWTDEGPSGFVHLYRYHDDMVDLLTSQMTLGEYVPEGPPDADGADALEELRLLRRAMREDGLRVPDLPPELAHIDAADHLESAE